jgi:hypothetical protein
MPTNPSGFSVVGFDPNEEWKPIEGFSGYEVSSLGQVRSFRSRNGKGPLKEVPRLLKQGSSKGKEYLRVGLSTQERVCCFSVHLLVLEAFHGPRPSPLHDSCHNDGNAKNNHATNLRWDTKQANADDRIRHGTQLRGEGINRAVLTETQVREIKTALPNWKRGMGRHFANKFGVSDSVIHSIKSGQTWSHI